MNVADCLDCAADLIDLRGHAKGSREASAICALEAIALASGQKRYNLYQQNQEGQLAAFELARFIGGRCFEAPQGCEHLAIVFNFNDAESTRKDQVTSAMRATAALIRARENREAVIRRLDLSCV